MNKAIVIPAAIFGGALALGGIAYGAVTYATHQGQQAVAAVPAPGYVMGGLWLVAAVLFVAAVVLMVAGRAAWRLTALAGVVVSAPMIGLMPGHAVAGLVVDGLVLIAVSWLRARAVTS